MRRTYTDPNGITYDKLDKLCSAWNITTAQYYTRKYAHKDWTLEQILTMVPQIGPEIIDHTGEERMNNEGKRMVITACPNAHNMTVLFPDSGLERTGVYYTDFMRGMVKEKMSLDGRKKSRIGERKQQNNGSWCEIIEYNNHNDILLRFENGHETRTDYNRFIKGEVGDGSNYHIQDLTGHIYTNKIGETFKVTKDMSDVVEITFDNGVTKVIPRKSCNKNQCSGYRRKQRSYYIGKQIFSKSGDVYTITKLYPRDYSTKGRLSRQYVDVIGPEGKEEHVSVSALQIRTARPSEFATNVRESRDRIQRLNGEKFIKSVLGQQGITACGTRITIIGGTGRGDVTVSTSDGKVIEHQKYYKFTNNQISISASATIHANKKSKYLGMRVRQLVGYTAEIIEYSDHENILVRFEDGEIVKTNTFHFTHGQVAHPKVKAASKTSLNEYTLYYSFQKAGFSKKHIYDKALPLLYGKELDLFNPDLMIAIEYDGYLHKKTKRRDKEKDRLCKESGITIYRIREPHVPLLNDGISHEYQLQDAHYFCPSLRDAISCIAEDISSKYQIRINVPDLTDDKLKREIIDQFSERESFKKHIGEKSVNKDGFPMEIVDYRGYQRVDVKFENGYIATNRTLFDFHKGRIFCVQSHIGERYITRMGLGITIIADRSPHKVDIKFDDGTVLKNRNYGDVKAGRIAHPDRHNLSLKKYIGEEVLCRNGLKCTVIKAYREQSQCKCRASHVYVDVQYEDGIVVKHTEITHFRAGDVRKPGNIKLAQKNSPKCQAYFSRLKTEAKGRYMSQEYISKDGYPFIVVRYHDDGHLRIRFSDGYELNTKGFMVKKGKLLRHTGINKPRNTVDFDEWVADDLAKKNA